MESSVRYQRTFLIFSPEDRGFGAGQEPSGYVKMEVNAGKGKLTAAIQNLKENNRYEYRLYLLHCNADKVSAVCAGIIVLQRNKCDLKWEFDPVDVSNTGLSIQDFNVAAVLGVRKDGQGSDIVCPLSAYRDNKKMDWRKNLIEAIYPSRTVIPDEEKDRQVPAMKVEAETFEHQEKPEVQHGDILDKYEIDIESRYIPSENAPEVESRTKTPKFIEDDSSVRSPEIDMENKGVDRNEEEFKVEETKKDSKTDYEEYNEVIKRLDRGESHIPDTGTPVDNTYMSTGFCIPCGTVGGINPCANCPGHSAMTGRNPAAAEVGDIIKLRDNLDKYFENYDPFRSRRKDYKWWKVNSPVHLNNIMYQCNIKTPLLFNPAVMMAHFKYRHLVVGIYSDRARKREYIVCGVPGVYRVDDKPFGEMCRWVQVEGSRPKYGAFGYWLVYIDGKSGKLLNVN